MNRPTIRPFCFLTASLFVVYALPFPSLSQGQKPIPAPAEAPPVIHLASPASTASPAAMPQPPEFLKIKKLPHEHYKRYGATAGRIARVQWLDRAAAADPSIVSVICSHSHSAFILAQHPHLDRIADADHYLCRRLTKWRGAAWALAQNPHADHVIALDPEGIYRAIRANPGLANKLARHPMFNQMITDTPELGDVIARHM